MSEPANGTHEVELPPPPPKPKWVREGEAFRRLLPGLLATHRGKYVAIHEGRVVDEGEDEFALIDRVRGRLGNVAIHVDLVTDEVRPPKRVSVQPSKRVDWR